MSEERVTQQTDHDADYSPEYQDEYQRLWHGAAARAEAAESELAELREALRAEAESWRGKARANAVVDGPEDKYAEYLLRAEVFEQAAALASTPDEGEG